MKKTLLTLIAIGGLFFASNAQEFGFEKGNTILEGGLQFSTVKDGGSAVAFTPSLGYFVTDKFAVGLGLNVMSSKNHADISILGNTDDPYKANVFGAGVYGRYYFLEVGSRFKTYAQASLGFDTYKVTENVGAEEGKASSVGLNGTVGANFFLTPKIAVGYQFANVLGINSFKPDGGESTSVISGNINNFGNFFSDGRFSLTFKF